MDEQRVPVRDDVVTDLTRLTLKADTVRIDSDEFGWEMVVTTEEGYRIRFNIHGCADEVYEQARQIDRWQAEGRDAAAAYVPPVTRDDLDAYEPGDPKRLSLQRDIDERGGA
jgi:hypothetical protein